MFHVEITIKTNVTTNDDDDDKMRTKIDYIERWGGEIDDTNCLRALGFVWFWFTRSH